MRTSDIEVSFSPCTLFFMIYQSPKMVARHTGPTQRVALTGSSLAHNESWVDYKN